MDSKTESTNAEIASVITLSAMSAPLQSSTPAATVLLPNTAINAHNQPEVLLPVSPLLADSSSSSSPGSVARDTALALGSLALSSASSAASLLNSALQPFLVSESPYAIHEFHHSYPVVLVHGFRLLGFLDDPKRHFRGVPSLYKSKGLTVIVPALPAVDDIETRARALGRALGLLHPNGLPINLPSTQDLEGGASAIVATDEKGSSVGSKENSGESEMFDSSGECLIDVSGAEGKDDSGELSAPQVFLRAGIKLYIWSATPFDLSTYKGKFNLIAHSMAGLDSRFLIALAPQRIASLHCISTPHWGSRVASLTVEQKTNFLKDKSDFVKELVNGLYKGLHDLTREHMAEWNKKYCYAAPGSGYDIHTAAVKIWSYCGSTRFGSAMSLVGMFEFDPSKPDVNDGVVTYYSSKWGHYLRQLQLDHLEQIGLNTHVSAPFTGKYEEHFKLYEEIANRLEEWRLIPRLQETNACTLM